MYIDELSALQLTLRFESSTTQRTRAIGLVLHLTCKMRICMRVGQNPFKRPALSYLGTEKHKFSNLLFSTFNGCTESCKIRLQKVSFPGHFQKYTGWQKQMS